MRIVLSVNSLLEYVPLDRLMYPIYYTYPDRYPMELWHLVTYPLWTVWI